MSHLSLKSFQVRGINKLCVLITVYECYLFTVVYDVYVIVYMSKIKTE